MKLYFLRHGVAVDKHTWGAADAERPLTDEGKAGVERVADAMVRLRLGIQRIVTSPLVRASETASIVARRLGVMKHFDTDSCLEPGFDMDGLERIVTRAKGTRSLLLVGHEPDFSEAIGELIGGGKLRCKKASLVRVDVTNLRPLQGELVWLVQPGLWS